MVIPTMSKNEKDKSIFPRSQRFPRTKSRRTVRGIRKRCPVKIGKYYCLERNGVWEVYEDGILLNPFH